MCGCMQFCCFQIFLKSCPEKEDLPAGLSNSSCDPSFYFGFGFLGLAPVSWIPVRHFALTLNFKMNLKQVAQVPWVLVPPLFKEFCDEDAEDEFLPGIDR